MARALQLAWRGQYSTSPNPRVGCVLTDEQGRIVGEGWHRKAGQAHAEVNALAQAGDKAKGATCYVTLEPCSHHGRTGPCADALLRAGVKRVVAAMQDPNPEVAGNGIKRLRDAGVQVDVGLLGAEAEKLNQGFIKRMRTGMPWVTVKLAASLDGKTALANGNSQWITGPEARRDVQRHRAQSCAVLSGAGTVMSDNPSLNVRFNELTHVDCDDLHVYQRQPLRAIIDGQNQLHSQLRLLSLDGDIVVFNKAYNPRLSDTAAQQVHIDRGGAHIELTAILRELAQRQCNTVWVEAGARLAGALLEKTLVDELIVYQAPKLLGGGARELLHTAPYTTLSDAIKLDWQDIRQVGDDIKITALVTN
ncbi:bifunctional diaminohydroxyphosphoribosylaminopyrimidine deaminase/5-amino-6-(5-phosphoribosylamino)uracil reductase RibD [Aestuariibacter salexigens]|uniref:bifunctional diaminohydroxyphosphoribosylaminopyrimidine deaminase/5-amino-6-(5-phosphoribosylamino)uracil reductase RibD n=1 Tax=Aestuariibacter salexigens TaxID=226010 RepID=UPI000559767F|nr:bifunctional diaminohydroxyphosphoribosylaminopyrimidine deaminase/5-amino-6-(5-phosphoribosylamino)uracil reductase RibD [Aestuariibacter salexigens]